MKEPSCSIANTSIERAPKGAYDFITWLPQGYGPDPEERLVCAIPLFPFAGDDTVLVHPLVIAMKEAAQAYLRDHPEVAAALPRTNW